MSKAAREIDPVEALREAARGGKGTDVLAQRLIEQAATEGLLDVAYTGLDSPLGRVLLAATDRGLVRIGLPNESPDQVLEQLSREVSPRVLEMPARLDEARRELERYFEGRLRDFELPLDWRLSKGFRRKVLRQTYRIPYGQTLSYGQVAAKAGNPRAYRAAGSALGRNPIPIVVPCHRVLRSGGEIGDYGGGPEMKKALLELEGALDST
jgi:methylated-DNA-[protein]-cysteine S-methyltransferase